MQLINGLSDEKVRWQETVENLEHTLSNICGDVLLAAGFVAYLGPFTVRCSSLNMHQEHSRALTEWGWAPQLWYSRAS